MVRQVFEFDPPERFVVGTVGEPGQRTFFLQAAAGERVTSVALEKQQVVVLVERVAQLLDEVVRRSGGKAPVPAVAPPELDDADPLQTPILEEFRVESMRLSWDGQDDRLTVEARAPAPESAPADETAVPGDYPGEDDEPASDNPGPDELAEDPDGPDVLRVRITGGVARAFVKRALAVVAAGRPACTFCGLPLDPDGHVCPRQNGYRR